MATTALTTRAIPRHKKPLAIADGVVMWAGADASTVTTDPQLSWGGTGAPTHTAPQYSIHIRGDNSATATWYRNTDGAGTWELIPGDSSGLLALDNVWTGTQAFGVSGTGVDVTFFGDTATRDIMWDYSENTLRAADNAKIGWGSGAGTTPDIGVLWDGTDLLVSQLTADSTVKWGVSGAGINHVFYGDTATYDATWDQTNSQFLFNDNALLSLGTGAGGAGDIGFTWDGTKLVVSQLTANSAVEWGVDGAGLDQVWYMDTAGAKFTLDQSADSLILGGVAKIKLQTIAAATGTAIPVTHSGSFPVTTAAAETNTLADPTFLGQTITIFVDTYAVGNRVITAASRINQAANTIITLGAVGDFIKLEAITIAGALKWQVIANDGAALS